MAQRDISGNTSNSSRDDAIPSLAERRAALTRREVVEAAIPLFIEQGYDDTSMAEVAEAAGMSRRTVYRHFPRKDDIVFEAPREWLEVFNRVVATREPGESTRAVMERAIIACAEHIEQDAESILAAYSVLDTSQELVARRGRTDVEWIERYMELLLPETAELPDGDHQALVCAMALVAAQNAIIASWAATWPERRAVDLTVAMLEQVDSVWPAPCR